jgi:hypothetical protein
MKATWIWASEPKLAAAGLPALADKGYKGALHAKTPYRGRGETRITERGELGPREAPRTRRKGNRPAQSLEDPHLATLLPRCAGHIAKAILVLQAHETKAG